MTKTYYDLQEDLKRALRLIARSEDESIKLMAGLTQWKTRLANEEVACIREKIALR